MRERMPVMFTGTCEASGGYDGAGVPKAKSYFFGGGLDFTRIAREIFAIGLTLTSAR